MASNKFSLVVYDITVDFICSASIGLLIEISGGSLSKVIFSIENTFDGFAAKSSPLSSKVYTEPLFNLGAFLRITSLKDPLLSSPEESNNS